MTIGEKIKTLRKEKKLTQQKLANAIGVNVQTVRSYESGKYKPKPEVIHKLAKALNVDPSELYNPFFEVGQLVIQNLPQEALQSAAQSAAQAAAHVMGASINGKRFIPKTEFDDFLELKGVTIENNTITFDGSSYKLTPEQIERLPDMSIEQIKSLIRSLAMMNERK